MSPKKVGWGRDIVAPRQEISVLSLLYEEAAIQAELEVRSEDLLPGGFLDAYREAREGYRTRTDATAPSPEETNELIQRVALFGAQAAARARRPRSDRAMVTCVWPDEVGVLAILAEAIAAGGGNIEGATMSIVAGHLVTIFLVSGLKDPPKCPRFASRLAFMRMAAHDVDWPRPGSSWWHVRASGRTDGSLLLGLTGEFAGRNLPLMNMASWQESGEGGDAVESVDLHFAIAPEPDRDALHVARGIGDRVEQRIAEAKVDVLPARWPVVRRAETETEGSDGSDGSDVVMTVVGHAEPGFVNAVLSTLTGEIADVVAVRGTSMAILEGVTVLTVVFTRARASSLDDLRQQIGRCVARCLQELTDGAPITPIQVVSGKAGGKKKGSGKKTRRRRTRQHPTHELSLQVPEQSQVVMKVARVLAARKINITWFVTHVREPMVGDRLPICDIQMHLHLPEGKTELETEVRADLRSLTEREGWDEVLLERWSVGR